MPHMSRKRFSGRLLAGILVALFFGVALSLRVCLPYHEVFGGGWIRFAGPDVYYHMRIVDNLVHNFPHLTSFDPYFLYPGGSKMGARYFFQYFLAGVIWLIGLGSPSQHTVDMVGAYFPAVLGALVVAPVYFIGKELFNRWAGVISAGLIAILPGEFLGRSILGFTDYHIAETLFTTTGILFLILAVKTAKERELTFGHIMPRPFIWSILAGIFLGIYLLTWPGAALFIFIISLYLVIQFVIDHMRGRTTDYLVIIGAITFLVASMIFLPSSREKLYLASLAVALLIAPVLSIVSKLMRSLKPLYYPLALIGVGSAGMAIFHAISPSLFNSMVGRFTIFGWNPEVTILECQPLLLSGGRFSFSIPWGNFSTGFFISFISLGMLVYFLIKRGEPDKTLLVVWSLVTLAATLSMRRFGYYFAVNVALLTGYFSWQILEFSGFKEVKTVPVEISGKKKKKVKEKVERPRLSLTRRVDMALGVIAVFFLSFFPNISPAIDTAREVPFAPSDAWHESLTWLRENTPDPFGNPDLYYEICQTPFSYPESSYSVISWWDYGYWITRIGRRLPICNPGGGARGTTGSFFTAQNEALANKIADEMNSRYVIIDRATVLPKFHALATFSGKSREDFYDVYYQREGEKMVPVTLFYPEYYRSLVIKLYNFDGKEVKPQNSVVISYKERVSHEGRHYKEITSSKAFSSYEEALAYISKEKSGNLRVVGANPFTSPVPLEGLKHYKLVHSSPVTEPGAILELKIFEYTK
jgi:dolichyl-diphosphooligosaccharide--protein glycosyltransferase